MTYRILPHDARRVLETIFTHPPSYWHQHGVPITTMSDVRFMRFLGDEMIPGGRCPSQKTSSNSQAAWGFPWTGCES